MDSRCSYIHPFIELDSELMVGETFENFFDIQTYSTIIGFSLRLDILRRGNQGQPVMRRWLCSKQGFRSKKWTEHEVFSREPRAITRVGCEASFRFNYCEKASLWVVKEFKATHCHQLSSFDHSKFLRSNRIVGDGALVKLFRCGELG